MKASQTNEWSDHWRRTHVLPINIVMCRWLCAAVAVFGMAACTMLAQGRARPEPFPPPGWDSSSRPIMDGSMWERGPRGRQRLVLQFQPASRFQSTAQIKHDFIAQAPKDQLDLANVRVEDETGCRGSKFWRYSFRELTTGPGNVVDVAIVGIIAQHEGRALLLTYSYPFGDTPDRETLNLVEHGCPSAFESAAAL